MSTTSINFHCRPSVREGRHPGKLFIRAIRDRKSSNISTDYSVYPDEWDDSSHSIVLPPELPDNRERRERLIVISLSMSNDLARLREIISNLEASDGYSAADVSACFSISLNRNTVNGFASHVADSIRVGGSRGTARTYESAARSLANFHKGQDVLLSDIDAPMMRAYESYLIAQKLMMNTVSFYLRTLRSLYRKAIKAHLIAERSDNPFKDVRTGVFKTRHRALKGEQVKSLCSLEEALAKAVQPCPDSESEPESNKSGELLDALYYFMFCYYARGMSFVDLAHLKKQDIQDGHFTYRRRKTGGELEISILKPMRQIISHFSSRVKDSGYVFPIIADRGWNMNTDADTFRQYESALKRQNVLLKVLAAMAGIKENLSTHVARHTWATMAKQMKFPVSVISEALGHQDVKTTAIYLDSFERSTMDELSIKVSAAIRKSA